VDQMAELVERISTLGGVLMSEAGPVEDIGDTLTEIHATFDAAAEAIERFLEPGKTDRSRLKSYERFAKGSLTRLVDNKRGHCSRILELYARAGGLREWLKPRATRKLLGETDAAFVQLSNADTDLFADLTDIAETLSDEANDIVHLLHAGQPQIADERIQHAHQILQPLRRKLATAMSRLQQVEGQMGFVPSTKRDSHSERAPMLVLPSGSGSAASPASC
jgi:hypothetical protein